MCSDIAISVKNLTKTYRIFGHPGDRIKQAFTLGKIRFHREFTALKNVSFEIKKGETVGILGRNGSGKSTLLQLICGILKPTLGSININGRISALLELGSGFNPEFTGRENVYFQGAVMGLTQKEVDAKLDEIVSFADIGEFIDQPVRTYSSGMSVRLAFAVSINVEPDILIIDEALAVGDASFQRKCFEKLRQLLSNKQRIVLFVSHDLRQMERLCSRAILIHDGQIVADGFAPDVCRTYYNQLNDNIKNAPDFNENANTTITSSGEAELKSVTIENSDGSIIQAIPSGAPLLVKVKIKLHTPLRQPEFIIGTQTADLTYLSSSSSAEFNTPTYLEAGEHTIEYSLEQFPLIPGQYFIRFGIRDTDAQLLFAAEGLSPFHVTADSFEFEKPSRLLDLETKWVVAGKPLSPAPRHD